MENVLLTGVAGFIGARTAETLLEQGTAVTGVDNLNDYYDPRLKRHRLASLEGCPGFTFVEVDIEDRGGVEGVFAAARFDAVINLAARAGVRASIEAPHVYLSTNALGTLNLLEACRAQGVPKFVLASTSSLYAGLPMPFVEDLAVNTPISPYAATKKAAEALAYTWHHLHGLDVSVLRYFTVYGPAGRPDMSPFRFVRAVVEGTPLTLYGDGTQARDFTFVDDIARGTVAALQPLGFEVINLGGGQRPIQVLSLIEAIERVVGRRARVERRPPSGADMDATWADITKAGRLLGWRPEVAFEEGVARTVAWYLANRAWAATISG